MKPSTCLCGYSTGCLYKLCSRWPETRSYLTTCVHKTQSKTFSRSCTLQNTQHDVTKLLSETKCVSQQCQGKMHCKNMQVMCIKTAGLHTLCRVTVLKTSDTRGLLKDLLNKNHSVLSRNWSRSSRSDRHGEEKADEDPDKLEHRKRMQRLSADNDMLSRFRNTYIMTLVSLASLQNEVTQLPSTIAAVAIATSELNLTYGTVMYISNLIMLHRSGKIFGIDFLGCVMFAVIHFVLWSLLLAFIFPSSKAVDEEMTKYTGDD